MNLARFFNSSSIIEMFFYGATILFVIFLAVYFVVSIKKWISGQKPSSIFKCSVVCFLGMVVGLYFSESDKDAYVAFLLLALSILAAVGDLLVIGRTSKSPKAN